MTFINRTYAQHKARLLDLLKTYFPNIFVNIQETSPEMGFVELLAYTVDVLSFNQDVVFSETQLKYAQEIENIYSILQNNFGVQPNIVSAAHCKLAISQLVPAINNEPDWRYALNIDTLVVSSNNNPLVQFNVPFGVDFNVDDERKVEIFSEDANTNDVLFYIVTKTVDAVSGYEKETEFQITSAEKYKTLSITDDNIIEIVSVFDASGNQWHEVPTLAVDRILTSVPNENFNYNSQETMPYFLKYQKVNRRFETVRKNNETIELTFGSGQNVSQTFALNEYNILSQSGSINASDTDFISNNVFGVIPENTTLTVTYRVGNGMEDNVGVGELNQISYVTFDETFNTNTNEQLLNTIKQSLAVNNTNIATGGDMIEDSNILKSYGIGSYTTNERLVTTDDYHNIVLAMPNKYGRVVKSFVKRQDNNQLGLDLYVLCYDSNRNFIAPNSNINANLKSWLTTKRILTDGITIKSAYIINIGVYIEITALPNFNPQSVLYDCLYTLKTLLSNDNMHINVPINISKLKVELDKVQGVQTVSKLSFSNKYGGNYSNVKYNVQTATVSNIMYPAKNPSVFEVKYPNIDITGKVV